MRIPIAVLPAAALAMTLSAVESNASASGPADATILEHERIAADLPQSARVSLSGGAVQFACDMTWRLTEIPAGRSIRLYLTPGDPPLNPAAFRNGIWLCFRWAPREFAVESPSPSEQAVQRAREHGGRLARIRSRGLRRLSSGREVSVVELDVPLEDRRKGQQPENSASSEPRREWNQPTVAPYLATYAIARLESGWFELYSLAPVSGHEERQRELESLWATIRLSDPQRPTPEVAISIRDAIPIVGVWKAQSSLLELMPDGRITITFDRERHFPLDQRARLDYERPVRTLTGSFAAEADLVLVEWDDGSRQNYRWNLQRGRLLLTDHHGRTSQLQRIIR